MSAVGGRLEARITVPVGGWAVSATVGGGGLTATVPAGNYYMSLATGADSLLSELQDALITATGQDWTVTISDGETGTGKVTIDSDYVGSWSLTWTSTDLRDLLGFTGNIALTTSPQTGANHAQGIWIPQCPKWTPYGDQNFDRISDLRQSVGPSTTASGVVKTLVGNTKDAIEGMRWDMVANARAVGIDTPGSWQHFWSAAWTGRYSYFTPGAIMRLYWDEDSNVYNMVQVIAPSSSTIQPVVNGWTGLYRVELPMILKVS